MVIRFERKFKLRRIIVFPVRSFGGRNRGGLDEQ